MKQLSRGERGHQTASPRGALVSLETRPKPLDSALRDCDARVLRRPRRRRRPAVSYPRKGKGKGNRKGNRNQSACYVLRRRLDDRCYSRRGHYRKAGTLLSPNLIDV